MRFSRLARLPQSRPFKSFHRLVIASVELKEESPRFLTRGVEPACERDRRRLNAGRRQETSMNHSIYSADRMTHLKIVVVALVAGILAPAPPTPPPHTRPSQRPS